MSGQSLAAAPLRGFHSSHSSYHGGYHGFHHTSYHGYRGYHGYGVHHHGSYGGGFSSGFMLALIVGVLLVACIGHALRGHRDAYRDD